ncbi:hypothetical protein EG327_010649 [Venturia inaequalis]|uniref:HMG box domain-containing protein n=1 Tax=Venturia inaequalis TaxID=5025 RepID=A0A8H3YTG8_VENIN|nr:hypothetical protein EG327_010649 [Venturia inaequalis]
MTMDAKKQSRKTKVGGNRPKIRSANKPATTGQAGPGDRDAQELQPPKRPRSAYVYFVMETTPKAREANPQMTFQEMGKHVGELWRELNQTEKYPFDEKARLDRWRHREEKVAYMKKKKEIASEADVAEDGAAAAAV